MDDLVKRLREVSMEKQQEAWGRLDGGQDLSIGAMLADEAAEAIIALRARADLPPKVKPLEWEPDQKFPNSLQSAHASFGVYYAQWDDEVKAYYASLEFGEHEQPVLIDPLDVETLEAAKAAAQADYDRRILSALDWPLTASDKTRTS